MWLDEWTPVVHLIGAMVLVELESFLVRLVGATNCFAKCLPGSLGHVSLVRFPRMAAQVAANSDQRRKAMVFGCMGEDW